MKKLFSGRLNRSNYLLGTVFAFIIFYSIILKTNIVSEHEILFAILFIVFLVYQWSLAVRRGHDLNHNGEYIFVMSLIPIMNIWIALKLLFKDGSHTENEHGAAPNPRINIKSIFGF